MSGFFPDAGNADDAGVDCWLTVTNTACNQACTWMAGNLHYVSDVTFAIDGLTMTNTMTVTDGDGGRYSSCVLSCAFTREAADAASE
jgi:hypothetical protein